MKLDGDRDVEPAGCKSGDWNVKKIENKALIDSKRDEVDDEADFGDSVEPVLHPSHDIESFEKFTNSIIPDPPKEIESSENLSDMCTDKRVTEYEPELTVCYTESDCHMIKDICVDEGLPAKDKILFEDSVENEYVHKFLPSESCENEESMKDKVSVSANHCDSKVQIQRDEDAAEKPADNVHKEAVLPGVKVLLRDLLNREKSSPYEQVSDEPEELKNKIEETVMASPALAPVVDEPNNECMPENGSITCEFDPSAYSKEESEPQNMIVSENRNGDDQAVTSQFHQSLGESSFSAVGPVSSRISYSGSVPYSGSISLRSDSSTTSTRSFAFPILQSEWNSSPVRMAKAERRHYRKHRGWRQGLCCRF